MRKLFILLVIFFCFGLSTTGLAQIIPINQAFSADTVFDPFTGNHAVYSLKISCDAELYSDSSLVRIILIDQSSNHYLVYETYSLIALTDKPSTGGTCDETCFMDGVIPDSIRIDIIDARVTLNILNADTGYIANAPALQAQSR